MHFLFNGRRSGRPTKVIVYSGRQENYLWRRRTSAALPINNTWSSLITLTKLCKEHARTHTETRKDEDLPQVLTELLDEGWLSPASSIHQGREAVPSEQSVAFVSHFTGFLIKLHFICHVETKQPEVGGNHRLTPRLPKLRRNNPPFE